MVIAYHADRATGESYASRRTLALEANVSTGTVHVALGELLAAGEIEIFMNGSGRKATTYRICSGSIPKQLDPMENAVVAQSATRSGSICDPVVAQSARPSIGGTEDQKKIEPQTAGASPAPTDPTAAAVDRRSASGNGVPPDAATTLAALKADLTAKTIADREAERQRLANLFGTAATEPTGPVARPVSAAAADARQAAPDPAAPAPRPRRGARGRKGRRGREPPTTCHRSHTTQPLRLDTG